MAKAQLPRLDQLVQQRQQLKEKRNSIEECEKQLDKLERESIRCVMEKIEQLIIDLNHKKITLEAEVKMRYQHKRNELSKAKQVIDRNIKEVESSQLLSDVDLAEAAVPNSKVKIEINYHELENEIKQLHVMTDVKRSSTESLSSPTCKKFKEAGFDDRQSSFPPVLLDNGSGSTLNTEHTDYLKACYVRYYVNCKRCGKPRCLYSPKKPTDEQLQQLIEIRKKWSDYICGNYEVPRTSNFNGVLKVERVANCEADVSFHYFSSTRPFPKVCYKCGSDRLSSEDSGQIPELSSYHAVCSQCKSQGHGPRIRKKKTVKTNKVNDLSEQEYD